MTLLASIVKPIAYVSVPVILLRSIAATSKTGRYYIRQGVYVTTLMTVAACSVVLAAGMSAVGKRFDVNYVVARVFYAVAGKALDLKIEVEGEEELEKRPAILMMNHQSMLDVLVIGRLMPKHTSMMAKQSLKYTPLGPFMTMSGAVSVDRGNNARAVQTLITAGETMKAYKTSLYMFPEGTRTSGEEPDMLPLKKGGFHLALQAELPIIPIVAENYWRLYHKGLFASGTIKVRVLPPISTAGMTVADIPVLATKVRDQMVEALREISVKPSGSTKDDKTEAKLSSQPDSTSKIEEVPTIDMKDSPARAAVQLGASASTASLGSSFSASTFPESERAAETEDEEGIVMVGRPE